MPITETRVAAYITGVSFSPNLKETVDVLGGQNGIEHEVRYFCVLSATFETEYDGGEKRQEVQAKHIRLMNSHTKYDYSLTQWSVEEMAEALPTALMTACTNGKIDYAGFDPDYPDYEVVLK